jgi:hypothetical protein
MTMTPKTFLLTSATLFLALLAAYLYVVDSKVLKVTELTGFYPQYLLESVAEIKGKVIVESGSNSVHGIEPSILAEYFGAPVIVVAQNASFPLLPKIYNLARYAMKGDVVILPLEWNFYTSEEVLSTAFLEKISYPDSSMSHYYDALPIGEKVRFILRQFPLANVIASLRAPVIPLVSKKKKLDLLESYHLRINSGHRSAFGSIRPENITTVESPLSKALGCDGYVLGNQIFKSGFTISNEFRRILAALGQLTSRGVDVYFTWPAVVDSVSSTCYKDELFLPKINAYAELVRSMVEASGIEFIGDFVDSRFSSECYVDTHYHITETCAYDRTRRLVDQFERASVKSINSKFSSKQLLNIVGERLNNASMAINGSLEKLIPPVVYVKPSGFNSELLLSSGWSQPEEWGVWSLGEESTLLLRVAPAVLRGARFKLLLKGKYYNGAEITGVKINGEDFGWHILRNKSFDVPSELLIDGLLRLQLVHKTPISPYSLGKSSDQRKLKYGLSEISLEEIVY